MAHFFCRRPPGGALCFGGLFASANAEEEEAQRKKLPPPQPSSGWINDIVARAMRKAHRDDPLLQLMTLPQQRRLLRKAYGHVAEALNSENLQAVLSEVVLRSEAKAKACTWSSRAWHIVQLRRGARQLREESDQTWRRHLVMETLKSHRVLEKESLGSKIQRLEDFWPQFHQLWRRSEELAQLAPPENEGEAVSLPKLNRRDWKARPSKSRRLESKQCKASAASTVHSSMSRSLSMRLDESRSRPPAAERRLRHLMVRRPVDTAPKASSLPKDKSNESRLSRKDEGFSPSLFLEGGITGWSDMGLGGKARKASLGTLSLLSSPSSHATPREVRADREVKEAAKVSFRDIPRPSLPQDLLSEPSKSPVLRRPVSAATLRSKDTTTSYLQACESENILPTPWPLVTGHSLRLEGLVNPAQLRACGSLQLDLELVNLEANVALSDGAIAEFLALLGPSSLNLSLLSLRGCVGAGPSTFQVLLQLIPSSGLKTLDLSSTKLSLQSFSSLCDLIGKHPLKSVFLADVGLGTSGETASLLPSLDAMLSGDLQELDLSWNLLSAEVLAHLGLRVMQSQLSCLRIAGSASTHERDAQASFLECLPAVCPLKELDISLNHMDYRSAMVLEDFLSANSNLTALDLSHNPLGPVGLRCLVRLMLTEGSGLSRLRLEGCANGERPLDLQFINTNNPSGRYSLELHRPDHRSVLRMLYKCCDRLGIPPNEAFSQVLYSKGNYSHPSLKNGVYDVHKNGRLQVTFNIEKAFHRSTKDTTFEEFLRQRDSLMRLSPSERKQLVLFNACRSACTTTLDQAAFLNALSRDIHLPFSLLQQLCGLASTPEVVCQLFACFASEATERCLLLMNVQSIAGVTQILNHVSKLMFFNVENPTGHYRLDLANPADYAVAESLVVLDSWEASVRRRRGQVDVSQHGNWSQVRNAMFQDEPLQASVISEWLLPEAGKLELDYSSSRRPLPGSKVLDMESFQRVLIALQDQNFYKKGNDVGKSLEKQVKLPRNDMQALRMVAHLMYLTALQTRALLECFLDQSDREDCLVTLFNRVEDMHNEKVFSVGFDRELQVSRLRKRLGHLVFFPWIQPEQAHFALPLADVDARTALCLIIHLAKKERMTNIQRPRWIKDDNTEDPLTFGLPRSWETFSNIPVAGTVYMTYKCAPEDRNYKARRLHLQSYSTWHCDVAEDEVNWWASTNEVPVDVMEFLEYLVEEYDDVYEAFDEIKRPNSNMLTLRDFEQGLRRIKCMKFKGRRELEQIAGVFRYLDPSGEGKVSRNEWGMLELCHKEIVYSIKEFVHFCKRSFGNDLNAAWAVFDINGDHVISEEEWVSVAQSCCYFGPILPIFRFLDKDDEATISFEEFEELQKFHDPPKLDLEAMQQACSSATVQGAAMRDLLPTRLRLRARLLRARVAEGGRGAVLLDETTLAVLQKAEKAIPRSSLTGTRLVSALERLLTAQGVKSRRVTMMKMSNFKEGIRELILDVDIPDTVSPRGLQRSLQASLETAEGSSFLHALRMACAQVSTLQVQVRPSTERLVNNLRLAVPSTGINARRADDVLEAAKKCCHIYRNAWGAAGMKEVLGRPSRCRCSGKLVNATPEVIRDPPWQGVQQLSGLLAVAKAAQLRLKERLAPGSRWAQEIFGDQISRGDPRRSFRGPSLTKGRLYDPGLKKTEQLSEEVVRAQRVYEQQDTAAHDLIGSLLDIHFESLGELCSAWDILEDSFEVVWAKNRFLEPDGFGYPCVQLGVQQQIQDPRYSSKECILTHISEITLHHEAFFQVKLSASAEAVREDLHAALARCNINGHTVDLAEAVLLDALDCTWANMQRRAVEEVERALALLERYATQITARERGPASRFFWHFVEEAEAFGCGRGAMLAALERHSSALVKAVLGLRRSYTQDDKDSPSCAQGPALARPVLTRITGFVSALTVEKLKFHFKDGNSRSFSARMLHGDLPAPRPPDLQEVHFDLKDHIVAVEQGPVGHSGSLGTAVLFFTSRGEVLSITGRQQAVPSRVRLEVHDAEQIVGLEVEFGRIVGVQSALIAVEDDLEEAPEAEAKDSPKGT